MNLEFIGSHLRQARKQRGISLREMARRIEVSPSFVSQVELGRTKPSVGTLYAFVSELGLSLDDLMADGDPNRVAPAAAMSATPFAESGARGRSREIGRTTMVRPLNGAGRPEAMSSDETWSGRPSPVQRADTRRRLQVSGAAWERLTNGDDPLVDFLHVTYSPGAESCPADHLMHHGGREYGFVISGRLHVQVAFDEHTLGPGDSISFDSMTPHRLSNPFSEETVSTWLVVGRRGPAQL
jgi:transcriptional regulator with XRE-family HTH domain